VIQVLPSDSSRALGSGPYGPRYRRRKSDRHEELLWVEIVLPRLIHDTNEPAGGSSPVWNLLIEPTHQERRQVVVSVPRRARWFHREAERPLRLSSFASGRDRRPFGAAQSRESLRLLRWFLRPRCRLRFRAMGVVVQQPCSWIFATRRRRFEAVRRLVSSTFSWIVCMAPTQSYGA